MAEETVKALVLKIDASAELLRRNLLAAESQMAQFEQRGTQMADRIGDVIGKMGSRFGVFAEMGQSAAQRMQQSFEASFDDVQRRAAEALKQPLTATGGLNLGSEQTRLAAEAAQQHAVAVGLVEDAARRAAIATGDTSEATRMYIQAASAARIESERKAASLLQEAGALERLEIETAQAARATGLFRAQQAATAASAGQMRAGAQQLGFQLQDLGVQIAMAAGSGNVFKGVLMALTLQGPQVVSAIALMRNSTGGFLAFLTGPVGAGIMATVSVLAILGAQFISTGDDADAGAKKVDRFTASLQRLASAQGKVGAMDLGNVQVKLAQLKGWRDNPDSDPLMPKGGNRAGDIARAVRRKELEREIQQYEAVAKGSQIAFDKANALEKLGVADTNKKSGRSGGSTTSRTVDDAEQLTQQYQAQSDQLAQQLKIQQMRQQGLDYEADLEEARFALMRQFPGLDAERLNKLFEMSKALIDQKRIYDDILGVIGRVRNEELKRTQTTTDADWAAIAKAVNDDERLVVRDPFAGATAGAKELARTINQDIAYGLKGMMRGFDDLGDVALNILYSIGDALIDNLLNAQGSGGNSSGGIGGAIANAIAQAPSLLGGFSGGGYTGDGPAADPAGIVHKGEYVFDAATTRAIGRENLAAMAQGRFRLPSVNMAAMGNRSTSIRMGDTHIVLNAQGAGPREVDALRAEIETLKQEAGPRAVQAVRDYQERTFGRGLR